MKRPRQPTPPPGLGYHPASLPVEGIVEYSWWPADKPMPPVVDFITPRLDEKTLELIRLWEEEAAKNPPPANG